MPTREAIAAIRRVSSMLPNVGVVLGSGLGHFAECVANPCVIPYRSLPGFPEGGVVGHAGELVLGSVDGVECAIMSGRVHYYEGFDMTQVTFPIRVLAALGVQVVLITNAAGAINKALVPGSFMLISDHLNLTGQSPLRGPNDDRVGPRFPDMSQAYPVEGRRVLRDIAFAQGMTIHEGVYAGLAGPAYETPAEVRMLEILGADAVGMSTVAEVIVAVHASMKVVGLSVITNRAAGLAPTSLSHEEVREMGRRVQPQFASLLSQAVPRLSRLWPASTRDAR